MHHDNGIWVSADDLNRDENFVQSVNQEFTVETAVETGTNWEASRRDFLKVLGFGIGTATLAACETPVKKAIPYVSKPDEIVPGVANYFASTIVQGGDYCSVLVKTREGRPIKIEGNSLSPVTGGGTSARAQAAVLSLYDTKRIKAAGTVAGGAVTEKPWAELDREVKAKLAAGNVRIITNSIISPSADAAITEFTTRYPGTEVITYDPVSASALLDAALQCFNMRAIPNYDFGADIIVSFGADFLGTWISPIQYARAYAKNRKIGKNKKKMNRHYQVEGFMSMTGASADNRIPVRPSEQGVALAYLYSKLGGGSAPAGLSEKAAKGLDKVAADLLANRGKSLVVTGSNNVAEQVIAFKINEMLGNLGNSVKMSGYSVARQGDDKAVAKLIGEMNGGQVSTLIVLGGANPAWELPQAEAFAAGLAKVGTRISTSTVLDETTLLCTHVAPAHHILESWGDASPVNGEFSLIQPTIAPIFKTRQAEHSLLEWADSANLDRAAEQPYYEYVKKFWQTTLFGRQSQFSTPQAFWDMSLHNGVFTVADTVATPTAISGAVDLSAITKPGAADALEIAIYETVNIGAGQYANNPWLQEMPDPVTRTVWGNYLSIPNNWDGVNNIDGWKNLNDGDNVDVEVNGKKITCTVVRSFGLAPNTLAIALGGGRTAGNGKGYGVNVNPLLPQAGGYTQYFVSGATVSGKVGVDADFACVQHHHTMGVTAMGTEEGKVINVDEKALGWKGFQGSLTNRSIIFPGDLDSIGELEKKMTEFHEEAEHLNKQTLYPSLDGYFGMGVKWEMFVDLNACIGCGACQVACVAENNVPVVGKKEVHRHHEMTWLRIDRYFYGDFENPKVVYQPMMCQHCDNAPCENVCPVAATPHSMEGLNQMAYNRCIGTRYCANNCPYKVRRFNWLDYTTADLWGGNEERVYHAEGDDKPFYADNLVRMVLNPDVTVRSRGVIEKCSFCVQRIQEGKLTAKRESREVSDYDVRSACQTACPTDAIVFGNANNKDSELNKRMANSGPLAYQVLEEINVRPGVHYTAKVLNTNAALDA
jgi:MoCo/4Fe-4S cofactor protein with predicted Tat translocation signal